LKEERDTMGDDEIQSAESQDEGSPTTTAKATRAKKKGGRSHSDRALAILRTAKRDQREIADPAERARSLVAEANVLALLEVADALSRLSPPDADAEDDDSDES
jgi:hypothetical protein